MPTRPVTPTGKRVAVLVKHLLAGESKTAVAVRTGLPLARVQQATRDGAVSYEVLRCLFPACPWFTSGRLVKLNEHTAQLTLAGRKKYSALTGEPMNLTVTSRIAALRPLAQSLQTLLSAGDLDGVATVHDAIGKLLSQP
jgi:hypothetical protein